MNLHYMDYRDGRNEHILSVNELKRNEASLELIDSVLLKCYIQVGFFFFLIIKLIQLFREDQPNIGWLTFAVKELFLHHFGGRKRFEE